MHGASQLRSSNYIRMGERSKGDVEAHNKRVRTYLATECSVSTHGRRVLVLGP